MTTPHDPTDPNATRPFPSAPAGFTPGAPQQPVSGVPYNQVPNYNRPQNQVPNPAPSSDERLWAMLAHLSAPIASVVSVGWLNFVGPLIVWLLFKDRSAFVRNAAAGAFNFQLTTTLATILGWILIFTIVLFPVGIILLIIGALGSIVLGVIGALKTWNGEAYTYPWQFRVLS